MIQTDDCVTNPPEAKVGRNSTGKMHLSLYFVAAVLWCGVPVSVLALSGQPVVIGTWTNFGYPDPVIQAGLRAVIDGMRVAVNAANLEGGVFGRPIQLMECEGTFSPGKYLSCIDQMAGNGTVATLGLVVESLIALVQPRLLQYDILTIPSVGKRSFNRNWLYLRANDRVLVTTMIRHVIDDLHVRRVGLVWSTDALDPALVTEAERICTTLGLNFTGSLGVNPRVSNYFASGGPAYQAFLAQQPQAILFFASSVPSGQQVLIDLVNRSATGNGVSRDLTIVVWDGAAQILNTAARTIAALGHPDVPSRLRMVTGLPHLLDQRYLAAQHAFADFTTYFGNTSFAQSLDYFINGFGFWIQTRFIISVLRHMNPNNLTSSAFIDAVFDSGVFTVDDLTTGMFADACVGARATTNFFCKCNDGYRTVETYYLTSAFQLLPVRNGSVSTSFAECASTTTTIIPPLVYLAIAPTDNVLLVQAAMSLLNGAQSLAQENYENCSVPSTANSSLLTSAVIQAATDNYVSLLFPAIVPSNAQLGTMAVVDPLYFPAQLSPPEFNFRTIFMMATLEQELYALAQSAVGTSGGKVFGSVIRSGEASNVLSTITASLNTFGASLGSLNTLLKAQDSFVMPSAAAASSVFASALQGYMFVIGLANSSDVVEVVNFLSLNQNVIALIAFSELSVLYDTIVSQSQAAHVESRIMFATSLVNWNLAPASNAQRRSQLPFTPHSPIQQAERRWHSEALSRTQLSEKWLIRYHLR